MGYSIHIPLPRGKLKIKTFDRLRTREFNREIPTFRLFGIYLVWESDRNVATPRPQKPDL